MKIMKLQNNVFLAFFLATVAVFAYLLLGGPVPGPVGEQYHTYLGALFGCMPSKDVVLTLAYRASLIFLLVFSVSWLLLNTGQRRARGADVHA
jgi:hypothetical protein